MRYRIEYKAEAYRDVDGLVEYLEQENPDSDLEKRFMVALDKTFGIIENLPLKGSPMETYSKKLKGLRRCSIRGFENYLIVYLVDDDTVYIARVFHSSRNYLKILKRKDF